jgi:hypothetical protein
VDVVWRGLKRLKALSDEAIVNGVDPTEDLRELEQLGGRYAQMAKAFLWPTDWGDVVEVCIPPDATVAVAAPLPANAKSGHEASGSPLRGRPVLPFPGGDEGGRAKLDPPDDQAAVANLELLRTRGARYMVFPEKRLWWLERYPALQAHLQASYEVVANEEGKCVIFKLDPEPTASR